MKNKFEVRSPKFAYFRLSALTISDIPIYRKSDGRILHVFIKYTFGN